MTSEVLTTPRLVLRTVSTKDADDIFSHIADWDVVKMLKMPPWPYTRNHAIQFAASGAGSAIEYQGRVIGIVSIEKRDDRDTPGYWFGKAYWGRGLMSETIGALLRAHFENPEAAAVFSGYAIDNPTSWRVHQKMGFSRIGEELTHIVSRGEQVKEIRTRLTREEFEKASR